MAKIRLKIKPKNQGKDHGKDQTKDQTGGGYFLPFIKLLGTLSKLFFNFFFQYADLEIDMLKVKVLLLGAGFFSSRFFSSLFFSSRFFSPRFFSSRFFSSRFFSFRFFSSRFFSSRVFSSLFFSSLVISSLFFPSVAFGYGPNCYAPLEMASFLSKPKKKRSPLANKRLGIRSMERRIDSLLEKMTEEASKLGQSLSQQKLGDDPYEVADKIRDYIESQQNGWDCAISPASAATGLIFWRKTFKLCSVPENTKPDFLCPIQAFMGAFFDRSFSEWLIPSASARENSDNSRARTTPVTFTEAGAASMNQNITTVQPDTTGTSSFAAGFGAAATGNNGNGETAAETANMGPAFSVQDDASLGGKILIVNFKDKCERINYPAGPKGTWTTDKSCKCPANSNLGDNSFCVCVEGSRWDGNGKCVKCPEGQEWNEQTTFSSSSPSWVCVTTTNSKSCSSPDQWDGKTCDQHCQKSGGVWNGNKCKCGANRIVKRQGSLNVCGDCTEGFVESVSTSTCVETPAAAAQPAAAPPAAAPPEEEEEEAEPEEETTPEVENDCPEWKKDTAFGRGGRVQESFCDRFASSPRSCKKALNRIKKLAGQINKASEQLADLESELDDIEYSTEDLKAEIKTEAEPFCFKCLENYWDRSRPTTGQTIGSLLTTLTGVGMGAVGYNLGKRAEMDANRLRIAQGYDVQNDNWALTGMGAGYPFVAKGIYGLTKPNTPMGGYVCSPSTPYSPYGHYNNLY